MFYIELTFNVLLLCIFVMYISNGGGGSLD